MVIGKRYDSRVTTTARKQHDDLEFILIGLLASHQFQPIVECGQANGLLIHCHAATYKYATW